MKCHIRHNQSNTEKWINLEILKQAIIDPQSDFPNFIKDCYSEIITNHLAKHALTIIDQKGKEDFRFYNDRDNEKLDWNVLPYYRLPTQLAETLQIQSLLELILPQEPDFLNKIKNELEYRYLSVEGQHKQDLIRTKSFINDFDRFVSTQNSKLSSENNIIRGENKNYFKLETYFLYPRGYQSFDENITNKLNYGSTIYDVTEDPSYLLEVYKKFTDFKDNDECVKNDTPPKKCESFKSYLMEEDLVVVRPNGLEKIIFPHIQESFGQESFAVNRIKKYKELKKEIEELKKETEETANDSKLPPFFIHLIQKSKEEKMNNLL